MGSTERLLCLSALTLIAGLLWQVSAELISTRSNLWDAITGMVGGAGILFLLGALWGQTQPALSKKVIQLLEDCTHVPILQFKFY